jgi:hypothetical protein
LKVHRTSNPSRAREKQMSSTPHSDDDNHDRNHGDDEHGDDEHGDDEKARIEKTAAQLRVPVATIRYWQRHHRVRRADRGRSPGSEPLGS